ncbi:SPOSA6832_04757 [Sporobolomyces salmonicolor]|uniref:SPOSA6832_04757-mRNA-1:cds n=1 Tax=Sporidiobolus salmonicolor TaxID=5005 RepID=A0A0D6ESF3_SPOSA|nr:SPOSA6832_04757 [Sporobolomyces salmonicolor]
MGLGKTIVVISLVSTTLAAAREWASLPPTKDKHDPRFDESKKPPGVDIAAGEFKSQLYGIGTGIGGFGVDAPPGEKKESGKKKKAREKREKKAEDAIDARFGIIECRSRATLIVCPLSTVQNWESQFEEHTRAVEIDEAGGRTIQVGVKAEEESEEETEGSDGSGSDGKNKVKSRTKRKALSIYIYHGTSRLADPHKLADYDVVITTFSTLGSEYSRQVRAEEEREDAEEAAKELAAKRKDEVAEGITEVIIKEHRTIQARAACDLSTSRRICLTGTPLQNSLNDIFSLIRFLRLEPFTDRGVWNQHIGLLAKGERDEKGEVQVGDNLGTERLKVIMRHLTLRRTKDTKNEHGVPILALPPIDNKQIDLDFNPTEAAFYASRHTRYKHEFAQLQKTDSVGKNYCTILQELLKLRQICVHPALLQDSEDRSAAAGGQANLSDTIEKHGISKSRAIQLLALMADAGGGECAECGHVLASFSPGGNVDDFGAEEEEAAAGRVKKPLAKKRKTTKSATAVVSTSSLGNSEDDSTPSLAPPPPGSDSGVSSVVTKCQHVFCNSCFKTKMCSAWPRVDRDATALCTVCTAELIPALDAVEVGARELQKALERAVDEHPEEERKGKKAKKPSTRLFEHSTKTRSVFSSFHYCPDVLTDALAFVRQQDAHARPPPLLASKPALGQLQLLARCLRKDNRLSAGQERDSEHIAYRRLDGAMNRDQRGAAMEAFKTDPKCELAGSLNLTAGRRVYLMEPFWNPAVEVRFPWPSPLAPFVSKAHLALREQNQAVDRIYRLGQTMPVQTIRFIMKKSIEANMLKIQQRKMNLAQMSVGRTLSKAELAKLRKEELGILLE